MSQEIARDEDDSKSEMFKSLKYPGLKVAVFGIKYGHNAQGRYLIRPSFTLEFNGGLATLRSRRRANPEDDWGFDELSAELHRKKTYGVDFISLDRKKHAAHSQSAVKQPAEFSREVEIEGKKEFEKKEKEILSGPTALD